MQASTGSVPTVSGADSPGKSLDTSTRRLPESREFCSFSSLKNSWCLEQSVAHSRSSPFCGMKEYFSTWLSSDSLGHCVALPRPRHHPWHFVPHGPLHSLETVGANQEAHGLFAKRECHRSTSHCKLTALWPSMVGPIQPTKPMESLQTRGSSHQPWSRTT